MALVVIRLQLAHVGRFVQFKVADPLRHRSDTSSNTCVPDLLVILHLEAHVLNRFCFLNRVILDKDVVVEPVIAMQECQRIRQPRYGDGCDTACNGLLFRRQLQLMSQASDCVRRQYHQSPYER